MSHSRGAAGAFTTNITPIGEVDRWGNSPLRRNEEEDSDLLAHAVVFSDGISTGAVVSLDITIVDRANFLAMREACAVRTGIPGNHITIAATHAHMSPRAAPGFVANRGGTDEVYIDYLQRRVVEAVEKAYTSMRPARMVHGNAQTRGICFNRRYLTPDGHIKMVFAFDRDTSLPPAGPTDNDLGYIFFEEPDGSPIGLIASFPPHNHVVGGCPVPGRGPDRFFHRDFYGRFGDTLRQRLDARVPTAVMAGACGDMAWQNPELAPPVDGATAAWRFGGLMADAFFKHSSSRERHDIERLSFVSRVLEIPDRPLEESHFCGDHCDCRGSTEEIHAVDRIRYGEEERVLRARKNLGDTDTRCIVEIGAVGIGDAALSTNPAQLFVELGLEIKEVSPFDTTLIVGIANGTCGYVPVEPAFDQGGYETHRSIFSSRLAKNADRTFVEESVRLLADCKERQARIRT